jgi:hypothetical protein
MAARVFVISGLAGVALAVLGLQAALRIAQLASTPAGPQRLAYGVRSSQAGLGGPLPHQHTPASAGATGSHNGHSGAASKRMLMSSQGLRVIGALVEIRSMPQAA